MPLVTAGARQYNIDMDATTFRPAGLAAICLSVTLLGAALAQQAPPDQTVDEQTAKAYDDFTQQAAKQADTIAENLVKRYELAADQQESARELVKLHAEQFLKDYGRQVFDLQQRLQATARMARENGVRPEDLPEDIRQDLARRALDMVDATQKQLDSFSDELEQTLTYAQKEKLASDRKGLEAMLKMGKARVRQMGGLPPEEPPPELGPGGRPLAGPNGGAGGSTSNSLSRAGPTRPLAPVAVVTAATA
jgi:hypothetical protein